MRGSSTIDSRWFNDDAQGVYGKGSLNVTTVRSTDSRNMLIRAKPPTFENCRSDRQLPRSPMRLLQQASDVIGRALKEELENLFGNRSQASERTGGVLE